MLYKLANPTKESAMQLQVIKQMIFYDNICKSKIVSYERGLIYEKENHN